MFVFLRGRVSADYETTLRRKIDDQGCSARVRWVADFLTPQEMAAALNLATAFLSVPRSDLLSISVLEGMACGCVPIVADLESYRPRLRHGENAIVIPLPITAEGVAKACLSLIGHPQWVAQFAGRNIALIREHDDWSRNAARMEDVYHWAIENPLGRSGG